ncbi:MAG: hypothetical protein GX176_08410 [Syntrophomonadaceae bacterium]|jgi:hypothetical protein|nr:hypothetical protein [Syntrophomonadaceae bacterium]HAA08204.1 hypothetical protein [Syntrophomonas sp.]
MIIIVSQWKQKLLRLAVAVLIILVFSAAIPLVTGQLYHRIPAIGGWLDEEHPSGNPLRVENEKESSQYDQIMDQFVIKLQNFYYEERE